MKEVKEDKMTPYMYGPSPLDKAERLRIEEVRLLYGNFPAAAVAVLANLGMLSFVFWSVASHTLLVVWALVNVALLAIRSILFLYLRRELSLNIDVRRWGSYLTVLLGASGAAFGSASFFLFLPESFSHQLFLTFVVGGMALGGAMILSATRSAFYFYIIPLLTPLIFRFFSYGDDIHFAMGVLSLFFCGALVATARRIHLATVTSLGFRFENEELIADLTIAKDEAEELNRDLKKEAAERRKADRELHKLSRAVEQSPSVFMITDTVGNIEYVNPQFTELTGYTFEEVKGKNPRIQQSGFVQKKTYMELWEALVSDREWRGEFCNKKKNGELYWESAAISPIKDKHGMTINYLAVKEDITEKKKAQERLRQSHKLLEAINSARSRFVIDYDTRTLFDSLLSTLLSVTDSEYGFIGEVFYTDDGAPYVKTNAVSNIAWDKSSSEFYEKHAREGLEFANLKTLFGAVVTTGKPLISNSPSSDPRSGGIPEGHPPLNAFLGLPFYSGEKIVGMVGIANRAEGYNEEITEFLEPFLATCGNIIEAYRGDLKRREAEEQISSALKEKEMLLSEVHHRVKNNMQVISSLLSLQSMSIEDEAVSEIFTTSQNYIKSMALVHEQLYQSKDFSSIDPRDYIESLSEELFRSLNVKSGRIGLVINVEDVLLGVDTAIPCGLVINELLTNAFKYAFPGDREGKVMVSIRAVGDRNGDFIEMLFCDNGIGLPEGLDIKKTKSFGLRLVSNLVAKQLHGELEIMRSSGTEYRIRFPRPGNTDKIHAQGGGELKGVQNG